MKILINFEPSPSRPRHPWRYRVELPHIREEGYADCMYMCWRQIRLFVMDNPVYTQDNSRKVDS